MSSDSLMVAGIIFIVIPTIAFGGYSLLRLIATREPGYLDNPSRRALWIAGHAHAGVLVMLALVALRYVDDAALADRWRWLVRLLFGAAPILMSAGFFLSMLSPRAERPNGLIALVYAGALCLIVGTVLLGVGLVRAA